MRFIKSEQGRSVIVTDNHPFIVKRNNQKIEIPSKEAKEKSDLIYSASIPALLKKENLFFREYLYLAEELVKNKEEKFFLEGFEWRDFLKNWGGSLKVEGTLSTSNSANSLNNKLKLDEDLGYLVGIFIAEGSYSNWRMVITTGEKEIIEKIKRIASKLGIRTYIKKKNSNKKTVDICLASSTLKLVFEKVFKIQPLAKNKCLPPDILQYNLEFIKGVIAGIIDGDGTVSPKDKKVYRYPSQISIRVASRKMLEQIAILLQFFGIIGRDGASIEEIGKVHKFKERKIVQNYPLYRLSFSKKKGVEFPSFKYQKAEPAQTHWCAEDFGWNKILNNQPTQIPDKEIYDITTTSHTFLANGLLVHNCCGWDLYDLLVKGFGGVKGKVECKPPKHLRTALGQAVNFLYTLQGECYSADTQVLTESGWKYFYEVTPEDKIFTLNPLTNEIQLQKPIRFYEFDWNGELYHFHSKKLDLLVTPNHRMLVDQYSPNSRKKYHRKFVEARNFEPSEHFIPKAGGIWKGKKENIHYLYSIEKEIKEPVLGFSKETVISSSGDFLLPQIEISQYRNFGNKYETIKIEVKKIPLKDWLAFFGFWLAEGTITQRKRIRKGRTKPYYEYAIRITQNIGKTASEFEAVLKRLPFSYLKKQNGKKLEFVIYNKQLFSYLKQFGKAEEKFIPQEIKELDKEYLEILFEWMMKGDGYQGNGNIEYYTKSRRLADDLQEIVLKLGYSANIYEKQKAGKFSWYVVSVSKRKYFKFRKENIKKLPYKGKVYCLEVPNHTLYVRRNGKACWCGNSAGAQAFNSLDTLLAPFIRYDNLTYQQVKQCLQEFVFNCAVPTRVGFQSLCWDEIVVVKNKGKIKFIEIGKLIDKYFEKYPSQIIEQHPQSYAVPNFEDWEVLAFNKTGKAIWKKVKAFIRHKVPKNSEFVEIRTNRGSAKVSSAHSLFAFEKLNGKFNPKPKSAIEIEVAPPNYQITENNHFLALSEKEKEPQRNYLDLLEILEDFSENFLKNVFVKINPSKTISKIKKKILKEYQSFLPFWKEFGFKDRGIWKQWLENKSVRFDVWKRFFEPKPRKIYLQLRNSKRWYPRIIKGDLLKDFVKLCAYYISEGHSQISTCLFISQAEGKNFKEIVRILKNLDSLGKIYLQKGFSKKGNKTKKVYKITGNGLLAEIIARSCGYLSFNKVIPWFIFNLKEEYQKIFIETLLKGGGAEFDNYWDISTTSKKLASSLSLLLAQNGFRFSVYSQKISKKNKNWRDQYIIRIFKNKNSKRKYKIKDFEARICLKVEKFKYDKEYEYDISVDLEEENFVGGAGLLVFHNTPFTNITLDLKVPEHMKNQPVIIGGKPQKETYGDFQEEMNIFNKAFYEVMCEGDAKGRVFSFPIPTINISKDFDWENPAYEGVWKASAKYGLNYFANFINSDMDPEDARSMCCRLRLDNRELYKRGGGLFGSWPKTGSIGVVTINLPRIGYLSKTKKEFFQRLKDIMDLAKESLEIKRKTLENFMEKGLYPYSKYYLSDIKKMRNNYFGNHFSTIGLVGMNEALLNFLGEDIGTKRGLRFAIEVLDFMRERLVKYQKETDYLYNLEATPAEGTSYRLARIDKEKYPDIITAGTKKPYYTNSTQLPVNKYTDDLFEALKLQDPLQTRYTGGTVFHIFLGERIADHWMVPRLIKKIFERFKLPYITITPTFSICPVHGYLPGEHFFCPKCTVKTPCEVYSRVVGYLRPVQSWNEGKQEEFRQRKTFKLPRSM